jgi:diguanylate cyclase (GGDEF)-like protein
MAAGVPPLVAVFRGSTRELHQTRDNGCMEPGNWLVPTELDHARVVDAHGRMRTARAIAGVAIGVAILIGLPWIPWWTLVLFGVAAVALATFERRLKRSAHPEWGAAQTLLLVLTVLAIGVAGTGGPDSPGLPWLIIPCAMAATRFRRVVVVAFAGLTAVVVLAVSVPVDPGGFADDPRLVIATLALLAIVTVVTSALTEAEIKHRDNAVLDSLTGLLNRQALTGGSVCVIVCDLDGFKQVNDTYGHDRGDTVLRDFAYEVRKTLRSFELVYRIGGEEFLVLLPDVDLSRGTAVASRLREAVEHARPGGLAVTISLGVAVAAGPAVEQESLVRAADEAMYRAKAEGRNRVEAAAPMGAVANGDAEPREADGSAVTVVGESA